jgi:hypothetical protein
MMMRFTTIDGEVFVGETYTDVVREMAIDKMTSTPTNAQYRRATAGRVSDLYNVIVDASSDESFVRSLVAANLLMVDEDQPEQTTAG